ncbi:MAG: hypothetical protein HXY42_06485 [Chloroflexi bacterium]|nr:hypothetical protein [Chloroflexota bacterium]
MFKRCFILLVLFLSACAPSKGETEQAHETLAAYFDALNQADYEMVIELYGGSYEGMINSNPSLDPDDRLALWKNACTINGNKCDLQVRTMTFGEGTDDTYSFIVEFNNPDGTLFTLGPCCGARAGDFPPVSEFEYRVRKLSSGKFVVLDMPVYVP